MNKPPKRDLCCLVVRAVQNTVNMGRRGIRYMCGTLTEALSYSAVV
jgi:hypothetical protein